jgi:hypothetical protein
MRGLLTTILLGIGFLASGCFVFDEIDSGMEIMEAHTPAANKAKAAEEAKGTKGGKDGEAAPTYGQVTQEWWKDATSLSSAPEEETDGPDPNATVTCKHDGKTFFTRRSDCLARGGKTG